MRQKVPSLSRWFLRWAITSVVTLCFVLAFTLSRVTTPKVYHTPEPVKIATTSESPASLEMNLQNVMRNRASEEGLIILASVDSGYVDLGINLYLTSFRKFGINNYVFVGSDAQVCETLGRLGIFCFEYLHDPDAQTSSKYTSFAFKRKTYLKTKMILEGLRIGLKVLITDLDIVFIKNPIPLIDHTEYDIEISSDDIELNSGFYLARPTEGCIKLHEEAWEQGVKKPKISNQKAIDRRLEKMQKNNTLKVWNLNAKVFCNGREFFERGQRMFKGDNSNTSCVIVHNNWIVSSEAKIYRFKEYGLWDYDKDGYYSNKNRKYLMFDLPFDFGPHSTRQREFDALETGFVLSYILNRILILPQFHCYNSKFIHSHYRKDARCHFGTFYKVRSLDGQFSNKYRENIFLQHELVPNDVKLSQSATYFVESTSVKDELKTVKNDIKFLSPKNLSMGASLDEIREWFGNLTSSVLRFHSLYSILNHAEQELLRKQLNITVVLEKAGFRQF